jgi:DNA-binding MarR family transcriptional regulator
LTYAQARVLRLVGQAGQPLRMADLATQLEVVPRSVTTMVDALETAGLAARHAAPGDRRSVLVSLTPAGRRLLDGLEDARRGSAEEVFGGLAGPERTQLLALLESLCARGSCPSCCDDPGTHANHEHTGPRHPGHAHREPRPAAGRGGAA